MPKKKDGTAATPQGVAYSYIRFSRPEQATGDSLRRQLQLTRTWCQRNGVRLDESLSFRDEGVSAFTGEHRKNPDRHALASFLELVKSGRVAKGSYFLIENLDRLTREHWRPAVRLFLDLLDYVSIVTTSPERVFRHDSQDMTDIIIAVVELSRGHRESEQRSERCGTAWRNKKLNAATKGTPMTKLVPAWIELRDGAHHLVEQKAAVVRRIYAMARDGYGIEAIAKVLNTEGVKPISAYPNGGGNEQKERKRERGKHWSVSYVAAILKNRSAVGEYQPHKRKHRPGNPKARAPDGPPIPGYFPAVISEDEWHATRAAVESRRHARGRPARVVNIFKNLLHDARTRTPMHVMTGRGKGKCPPVVYPYAFTIRKAPFLSFPLRALEAGVLSRLKELDVRTILPEDRSAERVMSLSGERSSVEQRIKRIKAQLVDGEEIESAVEALRTLENTRRELTAALTQAQQMAANPRAEAWGQAKSLIDVLAAAPDQEETRLRLRAAIRRLAKEIWVLVVPVVAGRRRLKEGRSPDPKRAMVRLAVVQIYFDGGAHRDYLIYSRSAHYYSNGIRPASCIAGSFTGEGFAGELDLRDEEHARLIEEQLSGMTPDELAELLKPTPGGPAVVELPAPHNPPSSPLPSPRRRSGRGKG
jgi:DNA invertase Pin-like site-specific DNA recombinase